ALVTKVKLEGLDREFKEEASEYVQKELRPNSVINLFIYNFANSQNGKYRTQNIRKVGEAPSILDTTLVEISTSQIQKYLVNKGYLNADVKSEIEVRKKKAALTFTVDQGAPFIVNEIDYDIKDPALDSLYQKHKHEFSRIHTG